MDSKTQQGYFILADISGFTSHLAQVELDHAHEILTELLEKIVGRFRPVLIDYFTVEQQIKVVPWFERATFRLTPTPEGGTRLELSESGRTTGLAWLDRRLYHFLLTKVIPTTKLLENLGQRMAEEAASKTNGETADT